MVDLDEKLVEEEITRVLAELADDLEIECELKNTFQPGQVFMSQVLVSAISIIAKNLNINIPDNCYIFFNKATEQQLSISDSAKKLIKEAKDGTK